MQSNVVSGVVTTPQPAALEWPSESRVLLGLRR
jgi:hypothetical protein